MNNTYRQIDIHRTNIGRDHRLHFFTCILAFFLAKLPHSVSKVESLFLYRSPLATRRPLARSKAALGNVAPDQSKLFLTGCNNLLNSPILVLFIIIRHNDSCVVLIANMCRAGQTDKTALSDFNFYVVVLSCVIYVHAGKIIK